PVLAVTAPGATDAGAPTTQGPAALVESSAEGVAVTALFQEGANQAEHLEEHVAAGGGTPTFVRLVELNGEPATTTLRFGVPVTRVWRCNLLGEVESPLTMTDGVATVELRGHEVATIAVALPPAPGDARTLDDDRQIWSTIHRD